MRIKELMKKPIVIEHDMALSDAAKLMAKYSINSLPIVDDGKILGIITHHDLIKSFGQQKKVSEIMSKKVYALKESDKLERAVELVREKGISVFPVVDSGEKIIGILDSKDILKVWDDDDFLID